MASAAAFLFLVSASFAKAGAMPFHTWIPEISEKAPVSVMAFLPASLDKLLGIYLLARICLNLFNYHETMWLLLSLLGSITIVGGVFMALVQHNMKKASCLSRCKSGWLHDCGYCERHSNWDCRWAISYDQ